MPRPLLWIFLSTPSARRATLAELQNIMMRAISIHALREEGDIRHDHTYQQGLISIHALREEGDIKPTASTSSCWISIHALREEGDL